MLPAFTNRTKWLAIMRASIAMAQWKFSSDRMVQDYAARVYSGRYSTWRRLPRNSRIR